MKIITIQKISGIAYSKLIHANEPDYVNLIASFSKHYYFLPIFLSPRPNRKRKSFAFLKIQVVTFLTVTEIMYLNNMKEKMFARTFHHLGTYMNETACYFVQGYSMIQYPSTKMTKFILW